MTHPNPLKVLLLASEVSPFAKTGGIAEVVSDLARALKVLGHDVRVAMPRYRVLQLNGAASIVPPFPVHLDGMSEQAGVLQGKLTAHPRGMSNSAEQDDPLDVPIYFIENPRLFDRDGIYMFPDDAERFLFFSRAALEMLPRLQWQPDIIHVNDWQTAIIPNWLKTLYASNPFFRNIASVYTIHNLNYFGTFGQRILEIAGLAQFGFIAHPDVSNEINRELNFMARGILFADAISTVSPSYAKEIQTPEFGEGLDPILRMRAAHLRGISNGIDYRSNDPATDPALASNYDADHLERRAPNKRALQARAGLEQSNAPLLAVISRLNDSKGLDLVMAIAEPALEEGAQWVVMGTGDEKYHQALNELQARFPRRVKFFQTFDETLRRQIVAGSDILVMASRVEPGGTTQLLAMRYGCVPIVHDVGGLADSVQDYHPAAGTGTGFLFHRAKMLDLYHALVRGLEAYSRAEEWRGLQERGMRADFSWDRSAREYVDLYEFAWEEKHEAVERESAQAREMEVTVNIIEGLPEPIRELGELVYNLWWSWNPEATRLLERIDYLLWRATGHNPIRMLRQVAPARLNALAHNAEFLEHYARVMTDLKAYMGDQVNWFQLTYPYAEDQTIAYFSAEFGIHESLPIYSGGLGILSGDHIKEASDMGIPLVGIGFLYPQGYFRQELDAAGNQIAAYDKMDFSQAPALAAKNDRGEDILVSVEMPGRTVYAKVWRVQVGRVPLYLMDTDIERNAENDRQLAARLYGGDHEIRIMQEIMLGIGGVRALRALGLHPDAYHLNEGHSAFLVLELARELVEQGVPFVDAMQMVGEHSIFTTHTPVPAGNDAFGADLMDKYFDAFYPRLGIGRDQFLALGNDNRQFSMTVLGLRFAKVRNGVSKIHGDVSRHMWAHVFNTSAQETPIGYITNGVHTASWLAVERREFFDEVLGPEWFAELDNPQVWEPLRRASDERLWEIQNGRREALIDFARDLVSAQLQRRNAPAGEIERAKHILDPQALTIGFARRFATYKRATLLLRDRERLKRILDHPTRPVQIIFAGKAHPADSQGQALLRQVVEASTDPDLNGRIAVLGDYGIDDARMLVQGVDVWLNNPRPPLEASGTSGEKAALNGVLNFSVLDGWWAEGYNGRNGWSIGEAGVRSESDEAQDAADAQSLYETLENEIVPLYYDRDDSNIPRNWIERTKECIITLAPVFSTRRMLKQYSEYYVRALAAPSMNAAQAVKTER